MRRRDDLHEVQIEIARRDIADQNSVFDGIEAQLLQHRLRGRVAIRCFKVDLQSLDSRPVIDQVMEQGLLDEPALYSARQHEIHYAHRAVETA